MTVAIVGAGMAGLACAAGLERQGIAVRLFDKGRRAGGRLSTLRTDGLAWDFGAQYFVPRSDAFAAEVAQWRQMGVAAPWPRGPEGAMVGTPAMASLVEAQCEARDVRFGAQVQRLHHDEAQGWHLSGPDLSEGPFDAVVVAIPSEQAAPLVSLHDLDIAREAASVRSRPCWTIMTAFAEPLDGVPDWLSDAGDIAWAARDNSKPGRASAECWVVQAGLDWTRRHLEQERDEVAVLLLSAFATALGRDLPEPTFLKAHRWRFGLAGDGHGEPLWNGALGLGVCGDWCTEPGIEGAWESGTRLAARVSSSLAG